MEPTILIGAIVSILVGLFIFWVQRTVSQRDQEIKDLKTDVRNLESKLAEEKVSQAKLCGKIDGVQISVNDLKEMFRDLKD